MLTRLEKENRVIELYEEGKTYREIVQEVHMSLSDISSVIKRHTGEVNGEQQQQQHQKTIDTKALTLFEEGRTPVQVAIELDLKSEDVTRLNMEWRQLKGLHDLIQLHEELRDEILPLVNSYKNIKDAGLAPQRIVTALKYAEELPVLERRYNELKNEFGNITYKKQNLLYSFDDLNHQMFLTKKMLDQGDSMIEQKKQEIEQLSNEKQHLENFISRLKTNSNEYDRVTRIAKAKILQLLYNKRSILEVAIGSILEVLIEHPEKQLLIYDSLDAPDYRIPSIPLGLDTNQYRQFCMENLKGLAEAVFDRLSNNIVNSTVYSASFSDLQGQSQRPPPH
jgi:cell division protein FtsB